MVARSLGRESLAEDVAMKAIIQMNVNQSFSQIAIAPATTQVNVYMRDMTKKMRYDVKQVQPQMNNC